MGSRATRAIGFFVYGGGIGSDDFLRGLESMSRKHYFADCSFIVRLFFFAASFRYRVFFLFMFAK